MRKLAVVFLLLAGNIFSQKAKLTILVSSEADCLSINASLFHDHVLVASKNIEDSEEWIIDSVEAGQYSLQVQLDGVLMAEYYNIRVKPGYRNYYLYTVEDNPNHKIDTGVVQAKPEMVMNAFYGNNSILEARQKNNQLFLLRFSGANYNPVFTYYSLGEEIGISGGYTQFMNDTAKKFGQHVKHDYYLNANIHFGLINRFTFFNNQKSGADGLKVDAGIMYNLPVIFRQYQRIDHMRLIETRHIHLFNEFYVMARISYKYVGLQAEYNLTTFLKNGYTEIPKYRAGLVFLIPG